MKKKKYWYLTTIIMCPVCGSEDIYKERQYTKEPKDKGDKYKVEERYDYCDVL